MTLDDFDVQSLNSEEQLNTNGGNPWWVLVGIGAAIGGINAIINDWDNFQAGLAGKCEQPK